MKSIALITGVAGGIGQAIARLFADQNWLVVGVDLVVASPPYVDIYYQCDIADSAQLKDTLSEISNQVHCLNALIHNAAYQVCQSAQDTSLEEWDRVMAVNVRAPFWLTQQLYPLLQRAYGSVVNISSVHAFATSSNIAAYAASKGALISLTRAQAIDFAADGVRVNAVLPGAVDTPMLDAGLKRGHLGQEKDLSLLKKQLAAKTVIGTIGVPQDIAEAVLFLADNKRASFITGQTLSVDGGALARLSTE